MIVALKEKPHSLRSELFVSPGYTLRYRLLPAELAVLREWIKDRKLTPEEVCDKGNRLFSPSQVAIVKMFHFLDDVRYEMGPFMLSDVVVGDRIERGREEVYFRQVRPQHPEDVGPMHRDKDLHAKVPGLHGPYETTIKCWIAIETEPGKNGLVIVPDSHRNHGLAERPLELAPGEMVLFNELLLHRGMVNHGERERVSVEITLVWGKSA